MAGGVMVVFALHIARFADMVGRTALIRDFT